MKVRNGFVSNSSSSSFLLTNYGSELIDFLKYTNTSYYEDEDKRIITQLISDNSPNYWDFKNRLENLSYVECYTDDHECHNGDYIFYGSVDWDGVPLKKSEYEIIIKRK